jgi:hypothetical protein
MKKIYLLFVLMILLSTWSIAQNANPPHYQSINPKIGIRSEHVWFKFGPSFETRNNGGDGLENWIRIGKNVYNFDLNFVF